MANMKFFQRFFSVFFLFCVFVCSAFAQPIVKVSVLRASDQPVVYKYETDALREALTEIQSFFASEMNRLGYGAKTFAFETNIPIYLGEKKVSEYEKDVDIVRWQLGRALSEFPDDIHLVFLAGADNVNDGFSGVFTHRCDDSGECNFKRLIVIPLAGRVGYRNRITAHELGHAFGFHEHLNTGKNYVMEGPLLIIPGEGHLLNFQLHPQVAKTLNASKDLSVIEGVNTDKFDERIPTDNIDADESVQTDTIDADVNDDGYVDLYDVLIVRSGMSAKSTYDTDLNNDGVTDEVDLLIVKAKAMEAIVAAAPRKRKVNITTWGSMKSR